jgi:putative inorganic carbon (hco3(-)) transporter
MLRLIFVAIIILGGGISALRGPFYALLFYLWYAYFRPEQWVWQGDLIAQLNLSLIIGIVLVASSLTALSDLKWNRQMSLMLLFFGQSVVSLVISPFPDWSMNFWIEFVKVLTVALLITFLVTDRDRFRIVLLVIAYSLGFEAVKQGWAQLILNPGGTNNNPHPVLGDNNGMAVGMMMLAPIFVALAQTSRSAWERRLHRVFLIGAIYRGISTYSRGGFLTAGAIGLIAWWRSPRKVRTFVSIAVLAVAVSVVMPQRFWDRMQTLTASEDERDDSSRSRLYFWRVAVIMANANPLTGVGFNAFRPSFASYDTSQGEFEEDRAVHSAWFGVLAEMGYPGLLLFVSIILVALHMCRRIRLATRDNPDVRDIHSYAIALQTSFIAYIVGMTFLNGQYNEMFWHLVGLTIALERVAARTLAEGKTRTENAPEPVLAIGPVRRELPRAAAYNMPAPRRVRTH